MSFALRNVLREEKVMLTLQLYFSNSTCPLQMVCIGKVYERIAYGKLICSEVGKMLLSLRIDHMLDNVTLSAWTWSSFSRENTATKKPKPKANKIDSESETTTNTESKTNNKEKSTAKTETKLTALVVAPGKGLKPVFIQKLEDRQLERKLLDQISLELNTPPTIT